MAKLSEARFLELWNTMPNRPEESHVRVQGDPVAWLVSEFSRIDAVLSAIATATGSGATRRFPTDLGAAMKVVEAQIDNMRLRSHVERSNLEVRQRQLLERAVEWGREEFQLFVDAARGIVRAAAAGTDAPIMQIVADSDAPLGDDDDDWHGRKPDPLREDERVAALHGDGTFGFHEVAGESHYQRALALAAGGRAEDGVEVEVQARLVFEPDNPYDPNAVAVYVDGEKVGYLSRKVNVAFREAVAAMNLDPSLPLVCRGLIVGGWSRDGGADRGNFGIRLDIPYED